MKIRKQTYSLEQYLKLMNSETIRTDAEVQRLSGQWTAAMCNLLIYTVLTDNYIPPIICGEEIDNLISKQWIIDGLQRSTTLLMFKYANTKITKNIDEYMVQYQRKVMNEDGTVQRDSNNEIVWESVEFDIRNKTFSQLPEELQDRFNEYQLEVVIHQNCTSAEVSKLIKTYNSMKPMNNNQQALTYCSEFASDIRNITNGRFFKEIFNNSKSRTNGVFERTVVDMMLLCYYREQYKKDAKKGFKWLNENGTLLDFKNLAELLDKLSDTVTLTDSNKELFDGKNVHITAAAFKEFSDRFDYREFGKFLEWFVTDGKETIVNGLTWEELKGNRSTRDNSVINGKIDYFKAVIEEYRVLQKVA